MRVAWLARLPNARPGLVSAHRELRRCTETPQWLEPKSQYQYQSSQYLHYKEQFELLGCVVLIVLIEEGAIVVDSAEVLGALEVIVGEGISCEVVPLEGILVDLVDDDGR